MSITREEATRASEDAYAEITNKVDLHLRVSRGVFNTIWFQAVEWAQSEAMAHGVEIESDIRKQQAAFGSEFDIPGYSELSYVLLRAFRQSACGKGKERHAGPNNLPFVQQPIMRIAERRGVGFLLGQADKKSEEAMGLPPGKDTAEILGAIVYLAAAVIHIEKNRQPANDNGVSFDKFTING